MRYNLAAFLGAETFGNSAVSRANTMLRRLSKPIRAVVRWQIAATTVMALAAGAAAGGHAATSAAAGGLISIVAGLASAFVASRSNTKSAGGVLVGALRAEAVKIVLAVLLLWLVLSNYEDVVAAVVVGAFAVTVVIFSMAFFVREY
jgi:ATP synthase protein I